MTDKPATKVRTPKARLSFPSLFRPRAGLDGGEPKYNCALIFDTSDPAVQQGLKEMKAAAIAAAQSKWGDKAVEMIKTGKLKMPFRNGEEKDLEGYGPGKIFFTCSTKNKPVVVDGQRNPIIDETDIKAGDYVRAMVNFFPYDTKGNKGVGVGLNSVQRVGRGPALGSYSDPNKDYDVVEEDDADVDSIL